MRMGTIRWPRPSTSPTRNATTVRAVHGRRPSTGGAAWNDAGGGGVLLKLYDGDDDVKVHDLVEVYGFIERASEDEPYAMDDDDALMPQHPMAVLNAQERKQRPPPSARRLHVIGVRKLPDAETLFLPAVESAEMALAVEGARAQLPAMRASLLGVLRDSLGGDTLAAEHVLLSLLSRVIGRHSEHPIGKFPLYLTHCPPAAAGAPRSPVAAALYGALSALLPTCAVQPLPCPGSTRAACSHKRTSTRTASGQRRCSCRTGRRSWSMRRRSPTTSSTRRASARSAPCAPSPSGRCCRTVPLLRPGRPSRLHRARRRVGEQHDAPITTKLPLVLEPANVGGGIAASGHRRRGGVGGGAWVDAARRYLALAVRAHQHLEGEAERGDGQAGRGRVRGRRAGRAKIGGGDRALAHGRASGGRVGARAGCGDGALPRGAPPRHRAPRAARDSRRGRVIWRRGRRGRRKRHGA